MFKLKTKQDLQLKHNLPFAVVESVSSQQSAAIHWLHFAWLVPFSAWKLDFEWLDGQLYQIGPEQEEVIVSHVSDCHLTHNAPDLICKAISPLKATISGVKRPSSRNFPSFLLLGVAEGICEAWWFTCGIMVADIPWSQQEDHHTKLDR